MNQPVRVSPSISYAEDLIAKANYRQLVIIESPFAGETAITLAKHIRYARLALADSISRGEAPFASHLLYTQDNVLQDHIPEERELGITCGYSWMTAADKVAVYTDFGHSPGMLLAVMVAKTLDIPFEYRQLPPHIFASNFSLNPAPEKA